MSFSHGKIGIALVKDSLKYFYVVDLQSLMMPSCHLTRLLDSSIRAIGYQVLILNNNTVFINC